jgi:hypothetical protein
LEQRRGSRQWELGRRRVPGCRRLGAQLQAELGRGEPWRRGVGRLLIRRAAVLQEAVGLSDRDLGSQRGSRGLQPCRIRAGGAGACSQEVPPVAEGAARGRLRRRGAGALHTKGWGSRVWTMRNCRGVSIGGGLHGRFSSAAAVFCQLNC